MSDMSTAIQPPAEPVYLTLARKLVLLALVMIVTALGLAMLLRALHIGSLFLPHIFSDASMGLVAGFSVRRVLGKQTAFLRVATLLAFLVGGLELLGWFTGWQIGLGALKFGLSAVDWYSLGQLFLGTGTALLTLVAWTQTSPAIIGPESIKRARRTRRQPRKSPTRPARAQAQPTDAAAQSVEPKRKRPAHRKPQLQLSAEEEHRCPYCLELVDPDDPRGTVECKICHTLHHADCWAITGACQVPHYTA
jgi:hypothetical protein